MSLVDLGKSLLEAAKRGDTEEVRTLMSNGAPFTTDWLGTSPLHFAAQYGHISTAEVLLRAGISRDARTKVDRTPLHVASQEGHLDIVELLVKNGADIEAKDMLKMTPLHWSVEKGHVPVIQTLLQHGADIHCENKFDKSAVEIAVYNGRADLVDLLQDGTAVTHIESTEIEVPTAPEATIEEVAETMTIDGTTSSEGVIIPDGITPVTIMSEITTNGATVTSGNGNQDSTSVLATLAALAEASGPMNASHVTNTTAAEALSWLEQHGITMISTSDAQTIVSPSDSQTITLTEAGKLALKYIKEQTPAEGDDASVHQEELMSTTVETMVDEEGEQRVITIVADQNLPTDSDSTPVVIMPDGETTDISVTEDEPVAKRLRLDEGSGEVTEVTEEEEETGDQDELRRQLEEVQKQAAAFKEQLKVKEEEAMQYKKQLSEIGSKTTD